MISMMTFCSDLQELLKFKRVSKDCVAKLCEDEWIMEFYQCLEKFKERIKDNPKLDMICYDIENEKGISYASYLRKCYEQAYLILMADMIISPMDYLRPDIMPEGLIVTPASDRDIIKVLRRVFETYLENMNKNNIKKSYIVANKGDRVTIPYNDIMYFESRNKKVYLRHGNEELGFYESMDKLEKELASDFIRSHRAYLINKIMIRKICLGDNCIQLKNDITVPISRTYKENFRGMNKWRLIGMEV